MALIDSADWDRPVSFDRGRIFQGFGGGPFRVEPAGGTVGSSSTGELAFRLDLIRSLKESQSRAVLSCGIVAEYATDPALERAREINADASISPVVLTDWVFRFTPSPVLQPFASLLEPIALVSNGLGSARLLMELDIGAGQMLEAMLQTRDSLPAIAEAQTMGVSPRVPVVVHFSGSRLLEGLLVLADATGAVPRSLIADHFSRDLAALPIGIDGIVDAGMAKSFAETMTDRIIARFGRFIPARLLGDSPVIRLERQPGDVDLVWSLSQPFLAARRMLLPVDLLSAAQEQAERLGIGSVVIRRDMSTLPPVGQSRVSVLFNLPASRTGVEALGITMVFAPRPPLRPQPRIVTAELGGTSDIVDIDVMLSPGEPLVYRFSTFAVLKDENGVTQVDGPETQASGSPLRLGPDMFPFELTRVEATPALVQLAIVSGLCTYTAGGKEHTTPFVLDSGRLSTAVAIPRGYDAVRIEAVATARDGSGTLRLNTVDGTDARFDLASFPSYGPTQIQITCIFDDDAQIRALSVLPIGLDDIPDNVTTLAFTPAEPTRTFRWFASTPFTAGLRYRGSAAIGSRWSVAPADEPLVVKSSRLKRQERARPVAARAAQPVREVLPKILDRRRESSPAGLEDAVVAVGRSPQEEPTDQLVYTLLSDDSRKLYVPVYRLGTDNVEGGQRFQIALSQQDATSTLTVGLEAFPAASVLAQAPDATEYQHRVLIELSFLMAPPSGARKTLEFTDVTRESDHVWAKLTFATLMERDEVYRALTEQERAARLTIRRVIDVEIPDPPPRPHGGGGSGTGNDRPLGPFLPKRISVVWPPNKILTFEPDSIRDKIISANATSKTSLATLQPGIVANSMIAAHEAGFVKAVIPSVRLAIGTLVRQPPIPIVDALPIPRLSILGVEDQSDGSTITLAIDNWADYSDDFFAPSPDLPPGGVNASASRTWIDVVDADSGKRLYGFCDLDSARQLSALIVPIPAGTDAPSALRVSLTDRRSNIERQSEPVATVDLRRSQRTYTAVRRELEQTITPEPFSFSPALHGYIFQGVAASAGGASQLIRHALAWKDNFYTYLQDASRRSIIYIFPDRYKIARRRDPPFTPFATVRVTSKPDGSDTTMILDYVVAPFIDPKRLKDARDQLLALPQFGASSIDFQPLPTSDMRFFVDRPTQSGSVHEQRPDIATVLHGALKDTLSMPLPDFRLLFDAMHQTTAALFIGKVEVDVPNGRTEIIPFEARFDDLEGDIFSYIAIAETGTLRVVLTNAIESPVDIQTLDAAIGTGGEAIAASIAPGTLPKENVAPGEAVELFVTSSGPFALAPDIAFDLSGVRVNVDPEAVWNHIFDGSSVDYFRLVTAKAVAGLFEPIAGRESERIVAILVEFEAGGTAELNADTLAAQVRIDYPITAVILNRPVAAGYRYSVTVIRANGRQDQDPQPRTGTGATFFVNVQP
ncbi:hypothetical protein NKJ23_04260 [Mesorhizobium sp. M0184]|uniref:hypothetical protein n=1 Tax=Mesorhizobium sp. M0184 TaxID=2956906 RepID=UPI00333B4109